MRIIKTIVFTIVILGVIGIAINVLFPDTISVVQQVEINGLKTYTINMQEYLDNVNTAIHTTPDFGLTKPILANDAGILEVLEYIANILIMIINFLLFPIRVLGYIGTLVLALIGINTTTPSGSFEWLVNTVIFFRDTLMIPYI